MLENNRESQNHKDITNKLKRWILDKLRELEVQQL